MPAIYARVKPKSGAEAFYRCGIRFTKDFQKVEVDAATEKRLRAEQMLEVSDTDPGSDKVEKSKAPGGQTGPTDPAERIAAIKEAITKLTPEDYTQGGAPKTEAIAKITGWPVTAAERDEAVKV